MGYKWEGIYPRRTSNRVKQKHVSRWADETSLPPASRAEKTNTGSTELIALCFIVITNARGTFCAQLNLLKLNKDSSFSEILCVSAFDNCCTLNRQVLDRMVGKISFHHSTAYIRVIILSKEEKVREWLYRGGGGWVGAYNRNSCLLVNRWRYKRESF